MEKTKAILLAAMLNVSNMYDNCDILITMLAAENAVTHERSITEMDYLRAKTAVAFAVSFGNQSCEQILENLLERD